MVDRAHSGDNASVETSHDSSLKLASEAWESDESLAFLAASASDAPTNSSAPVISQTPFESNTNITLSRSTNTLFADETSNARTLRIGTRGDGRDGALAANGVRLTVNDGEGRAWIFVRGTRSGADRPIDVSKGPQAEDITGRVALSHNRPAPRDVLNSVVPLPTGDFVVLPSPELVIPGNLNFGDDTRPSSGVVTDKPPIDVAGLLTPGNVTTGEDSRPAPPGVLQPFVALPDGAGVILPVPGGNPSDKPGNTGDAAGNNASGPGIKGGFTGNVTDAPGNNGGTDAPGNGQLVPPVIRPIDVRPIDLTGLPGLDDPHAKPKDQVFTPYTSPPEEHWLLGTTRPQVEFPTPKKDPQTSPRLVIPTEGQQALASTAGKTEDLRAKEKAEADRLAELARFAVPVPKAKKLAPNASLVKSEGTKLISASPKADLHSLPLTARADRIASPFSTSPASLVVATGRDAGRLSCNAAKLQEVPTPRGLADAAVALPAVRAELTRNHSVRASTLRTEPMRIAPTKTVSTSAGIDARLAPGSNKSDARTLPVASGRFDAKAIPLAGGRFDGQIPASGRRIVAETNPAHRNAQTTRTDIARTDILRAPVQPFKTKDGVVPVPVASARDVAGPKATFTVKNIGSVKEISVSKQVNVAKDLVSTKQVGVVKEALTGKHVPVGKDIAVVKQSGAGKEFGSAPIGKVRDLTARTVGVKEVSTKHSAVPQSNAMRRLLDERAITRGEKTVVKEFSLQAELARKPITVHRLNDRFEAISNQKNILSNSSIEASAIAGGALTGARTRDSQSGGKEVTSNTGRTTRAESALSTNLIVKAKLSLSDAIRALQQSKSDAGRLEISRLMIEKQQDVHVQNSKQKPQEFSVKVGEKKGGDDNQPSRLEVLIGALAAASAVSRVRGNQKREDRSLEEILDPKSSLPELSISADDAVAHARSHQHGNHEKHLRGARHKYMVQPNDTLRTIAEDLLHDAQLAWLLFELNVGALSHEWKANVCVVELAGRQEIELPLAEEIAAFYRSRPGARYRDKRLVSSVTQSEIDRELVMSTFNRVIWRRAEEQPA